MPSESLLIQESEVRIGGLKFLGRNYDANFSKFKIIGVNWITLKGNLKGKVSCLPKVYLFM